MKQRLSLLFLTLTVLAGCGSLPRPEPEATVEAAAVDESPLVLDAIALAQRVAALPPEAQKRELAAAAQVFARDKTAPARLRYGTLLALPTPPGADAQRAAATLEPLAAAPDGPVRQFAGLLLGQLGERQKEQRRSQHWKEQFDEKRALERSLREQLDERRAAERGLRDQLDELRSIERSLIERGRPKK